MNRIGTRSPRGVRRLRGPAGGNRPGRAEPMRPILKSPASLAPASQDREGSANPRASQGPRDDLFAQGLEGKDLSNENGVSRGAPRLKRSSRADHRPGASDGRRPSHGPGARDAVVACPSLPEAARRRVKISPVAWGFRALRDSHPPGGPAPAWAPSGRRRAPPPLGLAPGAETLAPRRARPRFRPAMRARRQRGALHAAGVMHYRRPRPRHPCRVVGRARGAGPGSGGTP